MTEKIEKFIRAFFAVQLDEPARAALTRAIQPLQRKLPDRVIRWVAQENFHVTLRFLGKILPGQLAGLLKKARRECDTVTPFQLKATEVGLFPTSRKPRAIAATLEPEVNLQKLARCMEQVATTTGLRGEDHPFRPHLTLGRVKEVRGLLRRFQFSETGQLPGWRIDRVVLFQSQLTPEGPVYTPLGECHFNGESSC